MKNWWSYNLLLQSYMIDGTRPMRQMDWCRGADIFKYSIDALVAYKSQIMRQWSGHEMTTSRKLFPKLYLHEFLEFVCVFGCLIACLLILLFFFWCFCCICCFSFALVTISCFRIFCCQVLSVFVQRFTITKAQQIALSISACRQELHAARLKMLGKSNNPNKTVLVVDCERDDQIRWNQSISKHNFVWTHLILLAQCASSPNNEKTEKARSRDFPLQCEPSKPRFLETVQ